jgi:hypothetical protein
MTSAEFRQYARECLLGAAKANIEEERQALIDTANIWTRAALQMEGLTSGDFVPAPREVGDGDAR